MKWQTHVELTVTTHNLTYFGGFKRENIRLLWVLNRGDLNFRAHSPQQGVTDGRDTGTNLAQLWTAFLRQAQSSRGR